MPVKRLEDLNAEREWECRVSQAKAAAAGKKSRPPEGNPFPESYLQHALWERDHEPATHKR